MSAIALWGRQGWECWEPCLSPTVCPSLCPGTLPGGGHPPGCEATKWGSQESSWLSGLQEPLPQCLAPAWTPCLLLYCGVPGPSMVIASLSCFYPRPGRLCPGGEAMVGQGSRGGPTSSQDPFHQGPWPGLSQNCHFPAALLPRLEGTLCGFVAEGAEIWDWHPSRTRAWPEVPASPPGPY